MKIKHTAVCLLASLVAAVSAGCACGPCGAVVGGGCDGGFGDGVWDSGQRPVRSLLANASCNSGCGEVYVDEWLNHPPTMDHCGTSCCDGGSCGRQPIRTALRLLWGAPYLGGCSGSCDSVPNFHGTGGDHSDCNCGHDHAYSIHSTPGMPMPVPQQVTPEAIDISPSPSRGPTPAPAVAPSSVKRLNPATNRVPARTVSNRTR
jgi:hypothetical protein